MAIDPSFSQKADLTPSIAASHTTAGTTVGSDQAGKGAIMPPQTREQDKAVERAVNGIFDDHLLSGTNLFDATDEELLGALSPPGARPDASTRPRSEKKKTRKKPAA
jgi:hypothetical protein